MVFQEMQFFSLPQVPVTSLKHFFADTEVSLVFVLEFLDPSPPPIKKWYPRESGCGSQFLLQESSAGTGKTKSKHLYLPEISVQDLTSE